MRVRAHHLAGVGTLIWLVASCAPARRPLPPETVSRSLPPYQSATISTGTGGDLVRNQPTVAEGTGPAMAGQPYSSFIEEPALRALIDTALAQNLDLAVARQRVEAARAQVLAARGLLAPAVSVGPVGGIRRFGRFTMDGAGNASTDIESGRVVPVDLPDYFLGGQASWEVDLWGRLRRRRDAAKARLAATEAGLHLTRTILVAEVATFYYDLQALENQVSSIERTIRLQEQALAKVNDLKTAGQGTSLSVAQFEGQLLSLRAQRLEGLQLRMQTQAGLNALMGRVIRPIRFDTLSLEAAPSALGSLGAPEALLTNRPDLIAQERELVAAGLEVEAARRAFYPTLSLTAALGLQAYRPALLTPGPEALAYTALAGLSAPILNRRALRAQFDGASAAQIEALYRYQDRMIRAYNEVVVLAYRLETLREAITVRQQQVTVLDQALEAVLILFRTGRANYLEVLLVQQNDLNARLELAQTQRRYAQTRVELYRALGGGWRE